MRSVPIWMAIFRASVAARLMAATDARRSGSWLLGCLSRRLVVLYPFRQRGTIPCTVLYYLYPELKIRAVDCLSQSHT
jgi:hypothetical protein